MDNATGEDLGRWDPDRWDLDEWLEITNEITNEITSYDEKAKQNRRGKKRRRPTRKNRKPSRPTNYIGQRSNNHLLRIFTEP